MKTYKTLSHTQRLQIECLLKAKLPIRKIAENIGVHISTIYRELKRGEYMHRVKVSEYIGYHYKEVKAYSSDIAQEKCDINKTARGGRLKIGKNKEFADYVEQRILVDGISPFAVAGELKRNNKFGITVCAATMYSYIRKGVFLNVSMSDISQPKKRRQHLKRAKRAPRKVHRATSERHCHTYRVWSLGNGLRVRTDEAVFVGVDRAEDAQGNYLPHARPDCRFGCSLRKSP